MDNKNEVQEQYDRVLYNILIDIWEAYRKSTTSQNAKPFNDVFGKLYKQYSDPMVVKYIEMLGLTFAPSVTKAMQR